MRCTTSCVSRDRSNRCTVAAASCAETGGAGRASFHASAPGVAWFVATAVVFTVGMYGAAETLASRVPKQEEYIARVPAIAIVPWFLAGSLFPISALPGFLAWFAKFLPLTHGLALVRYGLLGDSTGLHNIWNMHSTTLMATFSLVVVSAFAAALITISIRAFNHSAVR